MDAFILPCESACSVQDSHRGGERCSGWVKAKNLLLDAVCAVSRVVLLSENPQTCQVIKAHLAGGCRWVVTLLLHCLLLRVLQLISI